MKRTELIQKITALGAVLDRHGAKHDWYVKKETNTGQAVPRHNEIKESTARLIIKAFS
ncbi:MAG: type II toxin-antitoxin system HicA family toxin [Treponema sp.]|nr:type II toxin-antitoxin system HicA family toxin [Treponema sp.]